MELPAPREPPARQGLPEQRERPALPEPPESLEWQERPALLDLLEPPALSGPPESLERPAPPEPPALLDLLEQRERPAPPAPQVLQAVLQSSHSVQAFRCHSQQLRVVWLERRALWALDLPHRESVLWEE